ncbi:MAG: hypothetical protein ACREP9_02270, partial [Candidatus Dormibacteraceae bacterium]
EKDPDQVIAELTTNGSSPTVQADKSEGEPAEASPEEENPSDSAAVEEAPDEAEPALIGAEPKAKKGKKSRKAR